MRSHACLFLVLLATAGCPRNTRYAGFEFQDVSVHKGRLCLLVSYRETVDKGLVGSDSGALKTLAQAVFVVSYSGPTPLPAQAPTDILTVAARRPRRGNFLKAETTRFRAVRKMAGMEEIRSLNEYAAEQEQERTAFAKKASVPLEDVWAVDPADPDLGVVYAGEKITVVDLKTKTTYDANDRIEHESTWFGTIDFAAGRLITYRKSGTDFPVRLTEWLYRENKVNVYNIDPAALVSALNGAVAKAQWQTE